MSNELRTQHGIVTIRPAVPEDADLVFRLRLEALADYPPAFAADHAATEAASARAWEERITKNSQGDEGVICIASAEGQLIGMTGLARGHWRKTRHSGILWGVYVKAGWRGLGLAEALLEACLAWAQSQGLVVVKLGVITSNTPAIRFYARCGFTVYGLEPQVVFYDGVFYDELLMAKSIYPPP
jgi:RimJ/RimL family protein N-acetyltransferase